MTDQPTVSACLLTYNHAHLLPSTMESVLAQTASDFEVILSDDSSTDDTWDVVSEYASRDPRIRPFRTPENYGMARHANFAVAHARGQYIALLHHDDLYRPDLLSRWLELARKYRDVGFVFNDYTAAQLHGRGQHRMEGLKFPEYMDGRVFLRNSLFRGWGCPVRGTAFIRRNVWHAVGGMREEFGLLADVDLWMRLAAKWPVAYVPEPLITVRVARPLDYPEEYKSGHFSWDRLQLLYRIHAQNRQDLLDYRGANRRVRQSYFRLRINLNILKWIVYGLVKRRPDIVASRAQRESEFEYRLVRRVRNVLERMLVMFVPWAIQSGPR